MTKVLRGDTSDRANFDQNQCNGGTTSSDVIKSLQKPSSSNENKHTKSLATIWDISNWIVTIVQACVTSIVGTYIILQCITQSGNGSSGHAEHLAGTADGGIVYGCRCKLAEAYLWVLWCYFGSDMLRLYQIHGKKKNEVTGKNTICFFKQGKLIQN